jgi:hypothetical protein
MAAAQLLLPKIHEIETRCDPDPLRAQRGGGRECGGWWAGEPTDNKQW